MKKRTTVAELEGKLTAYRATSEPIITTLTTDISQIKTDIAEIKSIVGTVVVTNGGGREVSFVSREFFQMLYDRPKDVFDRAASFSGKAALILRLLAYGSAGGYFLVNLFKTIGH
jgi:hypothetical protein